MHASKVEGAATVYGCRASPGTRGQENEDRHEGVPARGLCRNETQGPAGPKGEEVIAEVQEAPKSAKDVLRYATEQLHALRPQPGGIPEALEALKNSLAAAEAEAEAEKQEDPPKDVGEALGRIE